MPAAGLTTSHLSSTTAELTERLGHVSLSGTHTLKRPHIRAHTHILLSARLAYDPVPDLTQDTEQNCLSSYIVKTERTMKVGRETVRCQLLPQWLQVGVWYNMSPVSYWLLMCGTVFNVQKAALVLIVIFGWTKDANTLNLKMSWWYKIKLNALFHLEHTPFRNSKYAFKHWLTETLVQSSLNV